MSRLTRLTAAVIALTFLVVVFGYVNFASADKRYENKQKTVSKEEKSAVAKNTKKGNPETVFNAYPNTKSLHIDVRPGIKLCLSNQSKVAKMDTDGRVCAGDIGKAKIDVYYLLGKDKHDTFYVKVAKKQKIKAGQKAYAVKYEDKPFPLNIETNSPEKNAFSYKSSNENVADVTNYGEVIIKGTGKASILVNAEASRSFHAAETEIPISVDKGTPTIKTDKSDYSICATDPGETIKLSSNSDGDFSFKSENENIAIVTKKGKIKPISEGKTKIIIKQNESRNYAKGTAEINVEITAPEITEEPITSSGAIGAAEWAVQIANDDSFTYGVGQGAHRYGCYFCGTNYGPNKYIKPNKKYKKTYCCNPFVFAAYAHGSGNKKLLSVCQRGSGGGLSVDTWTRYGCFESVGKPKMKDLQIGDVLIKKGKHAAIYVGNGDLAEAGGSGWGANSISVKHMSESRYNGFTVVVRYTGN